LESFSLDAEKFALEAEKLSLEAEQHVEARMSDVNFIETSFPYIYIENIFPDEYYKLIREYWPGAKQFTSYEDTGRAVGHGTLNRNVLKLTTDHVNSLGLKQSLFWHSFSDSFLSDTFYGYLTDRLRPYIEQRFEGNQVKYLTDSEILLIKDESYYNIGPHTDHPRRLFSMLFYCPADDRQRHLGTSLYTPKDKSFRCKGGPHYEFDKFDRLTTMPFLPNSLFAFVKSDISFHGVESIKEKNIERDLLLHNIRLKEIKGGKDKYYDELNTRIVYTS